MKLGLEWSDGKPEDATEVADLEKDDGGFYENIEAPKFVDFTVPDRSRPDDRFWFCERVGCDQNHEEVDPEALYKRFVLRVMAARSPNVRLKKSAGAPCSIPKCPQSAPVKTGKNRIIMSTMASVPEKIAKARLNHQQITKLRLTSSSKKENEWNSFAKKAFTTPRNKRCPNKPEPFQSVRVNNQKTLASAPKNKYVVKVLFNDSTKDITEPSSPSKSHTTSTVNVSDICAEMKKLQICSKIVPSRYLHISKDSRTLKKKSTANSTTAKDSGKSLGITDDPTKNLRKKSAHLSEGRNLSLLQEISGNKSDDMEKDVNINMTQSAAAIGENIWSFPEKSTNEAPQSTIASSRSYNKSETERERKTGDIKEEREKVLLDQASSRLTSEIKTAEDTTDYDENKENASAHDGARSPGSNARNCTRKKMQSVATESFGKTCRSDSKPCKHPLNQGGKAKKTTSAKPFRLRTNERGILKEANMGRRFKTNSKTEVEPVIRLDERFKHNGKAYQEKNNKSCLVDGQMQNAQLLDQPYAKFSIPADSKFIPEKLLLQKSIDSDRRMTKKPHDKVQAFPSSLMSSSNKSQGSHNTKESNKARSNARKRPTTVQRTKISETPSTKGLL